MLCMPVLKPFMHRTKKASHTCMCLKIWLVRRGESLAASGTSPGGTNMRCQLTKAVGLGLSCAQLAPHRHLQLQGVYGLKRVLTSRHHTRAPATG